MLFSVDEKQKISEPKVEAETNPDSGLAVPN
jgi:hypothetical protein